MKKINGNYTTQSQNDFPLDCETLQYMQDNRQMVEILGNIAGNKVILQGCVLNSSKTSRTEGYVFVKTKDYPSGEILFFEGGDTTSGMYLKKESISVEANAEPYPAAYVQRSLSPGLGEENYNWGDFVELTDKTNRALMLEVDSLKAKIAGLIPAPVGSIQMWPSDNLPDGYHLCDGSSLSKDEYPSLFAVLGTTFGGSGNSFKLPDMQGLFVAGKGANSYNDIGAKGGANKVMLELSEMPRHTHGRGTFDSEGWLHVVDQDKSGVGGAFTNDTTWSTTIRSGGDHDSWGRLKRFLFSRGFKGELAKTGGDSNGITAAHENRPPFIVLNYIIKIK
jgi:microcystin-dependent protein